MATWRSERADDIRRTIYGLKVDIGRGNQVGHTYRAELAQIREYQRKIDELRAVHRLAKDQLAASLAELMIHEAILAALESAPNDDEAREAERLQRSRYSFLRRE